MSDDTTKIQHSSRLRQKKIKAQRQYEMSKRSIGGPWANTPHRYHKTKAFNCGDPKCAMCGNPRKFFGEPTMQERRFQQRRLHEEKLDINNNT